MAGAELGLAVVGAVDLCLRYGKALVEKYDSVKAANKEISERVVAIGNKWQRTSLQLDFMNQIWMSLDEEHQNIQEETLKVLSGKLEIAISQISKVQTKYDPSNSAGIPAYKRWKYAFIVKDCLDKAIQELDVWQTRFDPTWYLVIRVANPIIDTALAQTTSSHSAPLAFRTAAHLRLALTTQPSPNESIFLPASGVAKFEYSGLPFSDVGILEKQGNNALIMDHAECDPDANVSVLTEDVRTLARRLRHAEPFEFNLLKCFGVVKRRSEATQKVVSFDFLFKIPKQVVDPQSLRAHLCVGDKHSLSDIFSIAKRLVVSVSYIHTMGFVHKDIRPETILVFSKGASPLGWSALVGFRSVRMADGKTLRRGDNAWEQNLYRHPSRQGLLPEEDYTMQHDIYSLGVCLLEIGLWGSLVVYDEDGRPSHALTLEAFPGFKDGNTKEFLTDLAREVLPQRMGDKYSQVVINCLTCMDEENADFGDESDFQDEDGVLIAVKYIEKILLQLDSISI